MQLYHFHHCKRHLKKRTIALDPLPPPSVRCVRSWKWWQLWTTPKNDQHNFPSQHICIKVPHLRRCVNSNYSQCLQRQQQAFRRIRYNQDGCNETSHLIGHMTCIWRCGLESIEPISSSSLIVREVTSQSGVHFVGVSLWPQAIVDIDRGTLWRTGNSRYRQRHSVENRQ